MKVSVIIPSYNEEPTLLAIVKKVLSVPIPYETEIIVVDDGSEDNTAQIFENLIGNPKIKLITNPKNLGKGASIIKALKIATGGLILIQDADGEYDPREIPKLLTPFKDKKVKVVYGSRVLEKNPVSHWTFNLGGRFVTHVANFLFGTQITDEPTGYKVFRKEVIKNLKIKSKGFEFCPEVTAKVAKKGVKIIEVPISYTPRPVSQKKIKWRDGLAAIYYLVKYRLVD
ncbi:hypothetical protein A2697_04355 [Candidatus Curtissbacteria bacterium RIFCSPHIGHO2_01_FULL_41_44]|uniref:Glycosyltransferase 2-like domain-containing protein n=1 Tax=Candidatus Curtissbacteria bacterium RIFCSPLOWO2_01_FULL_42_50 TaxID=1797730 RepID=A0A1F5H6W3_9BACT|nr:MAG: hypothetical protein A3C33_03830 [Candidatus Curtissbacteria bacterium RIFCSPHIGHO2_02_FULL_42_58]OGD94482.1 MAG: hypothetical protein A2697_04355 [Candidatus Curtissbacteria bacterium RIFCSPHIGHO2_01_FULL_41_44]OGD97546.1 MAG: hypothetical protein A3E71_00100 [Candidatus Curtissbacteria bacterium RIFCSPHIGHO2_12_FULL_42_33]OGD99860.1 MAG: hypothetical protein A3B54_03310 [Candidatus Curtissbacteria bacterium RIFCSPLOWO2_01_FULL_42_50]OGE03784.1 MAG: hypothetical protein A3G16_04910 [Ca